MCGHRAIATILIPMRYVCLTLMAFLLANCNAAPRDDAPYPAPGDLAAEAEGPVRTGAHHLADEAFALLDGRRVGLIVNHTAMVDTVHLADLIHGAGGVELGALFGPEHGIRGTADAGAAIEHGRDAQTGVPIYSLYGQTRKPTPEMLSNIDVLVFDIQDIGARFYTYISTMGLAMQAAAEQGISFVVLDRPNPLGGEYVSGFVLEPEYISFVGQFRIPVVHGLTVGELAQMIVGERLISGVENLDLHVVSMTGWERGMLWPDTGLAWIPPSPNIPDFETALVYPGACYFEGTSASEGRGTYEPFRLLGAPWADGAALAEDLNGRGIAGVTFESARFTPRSIEGMASSPKLLGRNLEGIRYSVTDPEGFRPLEAGIHVLHAFYHQAPSGEQRGFVSNQRFFNLLAGTDRLKSQLEAGRSAEEIIASWQSEVDRFRERRNPYLLY
jgi:uncharacterized protein YbbC (DUF1343 family)